ncbi:hypothetical protein LCGC14_1877370 [marine sediment metagenome]|uniref:Uncharacterized protein n=1 Tax=marine sediment metagenome TaxID=412755 RepID=A0A0F9GRB0_9ZZZZ
MIICKIRLAITEALLAQGYLVYNWRIPSPSLPIYNDHSSKVSLTDGGQSLRGFRSFSLTFDVLDSLQRRTLRRIAEEALGSVDGLLYASVDKGWAGIGPEGSWIDVSGQAHIPQITPIGNSNGLASSGVTLLVNNLTIVQDPAVF